jgi:hypothetical protein
VKLLLDHGANVNPQDRRYNNPLYAASEKGHNWVVKLLLDKGANVNPEGGGYNSPLSAASTSGHEHIVKLLLDHGANVNPQGGVYNTPLYAASEKGHKQVVKLLLARGANTQDVPWLSQLAIPDRPRQQSRKSDVPNNSRKYFLFCLHVVLCRYFRLLIHDQIDCQGPLARNTASKPGSPFYSSFSEEELPSSTNYISPHYSEVIAQEPGKARGKKEEEEEKVEGSLLSDLYPENFRHEF